MTVQRRKNEAQQRGFSLIEIVIVIAILSVIAGFIGRPLVDLIQNRVEIVQRTDGRADVAYALSRISNEIRFTNWNPLRRRLLSNKDHLLLPRL